MKYQLFIAFFFISFFSFSQKNNTELLKAQDQINTYSDVFFKFPVQNASEINKLPGFISIDSKTKITKDIVYAYVHKSRFDDLLALEIPFEVVAKTKNAKALTMATTVGEMVNWDRYPTYDVYMQMMQDFATNYPAICRLESIGTSQNGRDISVLRITDNPDDDENEPEFFYTGQMHGDEIVSYIMLLRLADYLLANYGSNSQVDNLIDNVEIWINPLANPDGTYQGGNNTVSGAMRSLNNGVDPNRNFPAPGDDHPDGNAWAQETVDMMTFADTHNIVLSSNIHSGAEVVNYPWDTWVSAVRIHADDDWWQFVSHEYADQVHVNSSGYMTGYNNGITNGGDWYVIDGGRQDYMTYFKQGREFTLELSDAKFLDAAVLPAHWNYNYQSLLLYMEQSLYGIRGIITDVVTGEPIEAKVEIVGHDDDVSFVYSNLPVGNYHRLIYEGTYTVTISAPCYVSQTFSNISVTNYQTTLLDAQLIASGFSSVFETEDTVVQLGESIDFTDVSCGNPTSWNWTFEGGIPSTSTDKNPMNITYNQTGTFDVSLTISDGTNTDTQTIADYISVNNEFAMENSTITTCQGIFYDSGGNSASYQSNEDYTMTFLPVESYGKVICNFLSFDIEDDYACDYDWLKIYDGEDITASLIGTYCGTDSPGEITADNTSGALTFVFHSDSSVNGAGWEAEISCDNSVSVDSIEIKTVKLIPNPANDRLKIQTEKQILAIQLFSLEGSSILHNLYNAKKEVILDVKEIPSGIYVVKVYTKSGVYASKLIKI